LLKEVGQLLLAFFFDLLHGADDVLRVEAALDIAAPQRLVPALQLNQLQLLQFEHGPLQDVLGVHEGTTIAFLRHQSLPKLQVDLEDGLEAEGRALVLGHVADHRHHDVLGVGAGCMGRGVLLRRLMWMGGKMKRKLPLRC
jgi:hypothetical protein